MNRLLCILLGHRWLSEYVGTIPYQEHRVGPFTLVCRGRDFWTNECRRCGKKTGPTVALDPRVT